MASFFFFFTGLLYLFGVDNARAGIDADFNIAIKHIVISIFIFFITFFLPVRKEENLYKCSKCGEVSFESKLKEELKCNDCNSLMIEVNEYYETKVKPRLSKTNIEG